MSQPAPKSRWPLRLLAVTLLLLLGLAYLYLKDPTLLDVLFAAGE